MQVPGKIVIDGGRSGSRLGSILRGEVAVYLKSLNQGTGAGPEMFKVHDICLKIIYNVPQRESNIQKSSSCSSIFDVDVADEGKRTVIDTGCC